MKQDRVAPAPVELKQDRAASAPVTSIVQKALAVPVDKMPDIYDLYDADNTCIGRGSVQQFNLSLTLRSAAEKGAWVQIQWQPEFNGYEITSIV